VIDLSLPVHLPPSCTLGHSPLQRDRSRHRRPAGSAADWSLGRRGLAVPPLARSQAEMTFRIVEDRLQMSPFYQHISITFYIRWEYITQMLRISLYFEAQKLANCVNQRIYVLYYSF
jgi:hypothetical protein